MLFDTFNVQLKDHNYLFIKNKFLIQINLISLEIYRVESLYILLDSITLHCLTCEASACYKEVQIVRRHYITVRKISPLILTLEPPQRSHLANACTKLIRRQYTTCIPLYSFLHMQLFIICHGKHYVTFIYFFLRDMYISSAMLLSINI